MGQDRSLDGVTALVTGAARGVGRAVCQRLAGLGARVVGTDVLPVGDDVGCAVTVRADLADPDDCAKVVEAGQGATVVVNSAGLLRPQALEDISVADFDHVMAVNLRATFLVCQAFAPVMAAGGWGRIVNFSSVNAHTGGTTSAPYAAAKAGVLGLTRALAKQYARQGVTVNAIAPAAVDTELNAFLTPEGRAQVEAAVPVGRFSTPEEFAGVVAFLVGDSAGFITGQTIDVNGGWIMR
ncbi:SDR family NAD(P)-dependent oxidoreductase [Micromonospora cathayae]|uniref:SDR family oxidoreductase n=1 Tax=Micromonospora cathayae TaxID=3028804 RepID=A0ABY7ZLC4_9ACTN|nr:SDR family oxidoreductase [Micromonospora sp. HUAS 3]WDZ83795.1 SDR family oxidoreductase [Micromonospora sp. HUAS 3]